MKHQRCGSVLLTSIGMIIMLCMVSAVTIDLGYMHCNKSRMQSAADAAAIAAAMRVGNENTEETRNTARLWAVNFANQNLFGLGDVLVKEDVVFGMWDPASKTFVEGGDVPNAVRVLVRRDGKNTDRVSTFFMSMFGQPEIALLSASTATISPSGGAKGVPMALRAPDFGPIDPKVSAKNPGKDGPSSPANGESFQVGDSVVVAIYGKGKQAPVHLTLGIDSDGPGAAKSDVKKILKGDMDPVAMQVGDEVRVLNQGTGGSSYGEALDDRLRLAADDPDRNIVMAVVETLPDSRNSRGQLTGDVRIADFVSVHLDEIVEARVVDPNNSSKSIKVRYLMGTISNRRAETSWGAASPSGAGGGTVSVSELVQ